MAAVEHLARDGRDDAEPALPGDEWHLATVFEKLADAIPDRLVMVQGSRRFTYRDFEDRAARIAAALLSFGAQPGTKVALCLYNCPEYKELQVAASKVRGTVINVNYRYRAEELVYLLGNSDSEVLFYHRHLRDAILEIRDRLPNIRAWVEVEAGLPGDPPEGMLAYEDLIAENQPAPRIWRSPDDVVINYTGGTTGLPKGVMADQASQVRLFTFGYEFYGYPVPTTVPDLIAAATALAESGKSPVCLVCVPFMHGTGGGVGHTMTVLMGGTVVLLDQASFDPDEAWQLVERERVSQMVIVGDAIARPLVDALRAADARGRPYEVSSMRLIASAGVMWTREIKAALLGYADMKLIDFFGSTEGGMGMSIATRGAIPETGLFRARPNVKLLDDDGQEIPWGDDRTGRLAATGNVPFGYYKDPEKTARTFLTFGGIRYSVPGDHAHIAADGTITVLGRGSGCINTGGEKVFAEEVEEAIKRNAGVYDCLVIGIPDPRFVNVVAALVQPRSERPTEEALRDTVRAQLSGYKVPKRIFFVDRIRRAPNGKADYAWARAHAQEVLAGETLHNAGVTAYPDGIAAASRRQGSADPLLPSDRSADVD